MGLHTWLGLKSPRRKRAAPRLPPECAMWWEGKEFTQDWLSSKLAHWIEPLKRFRDRDSSVLDVGTFEGRSAIAFLELLPRSTVTTVDVLKNEELEARCARNLAPYGSRVTRITGRSAAVLDTLLRSGPAFDVIYLDAGKSRAGNFILSAQAWPLLKIGGMMMWDDVTWRRGKLPDADRPEHGIRTFISAFASCMSILHDAEQVFALKTSDWPKPNA